MKSIMIKVIDIKSKDTCDLLAELDHDNNVVKIYNSYGNRLEIGAQNRVRYNKKWWSFEKRQEG
ncbi:MULTISPECIES: hypothetical protein [Acinetobacter]|uniref:Uncharacterized protein n=2 Tax=Acinetobacter calcoaceticus TaxID=471 RepID=A0A446ZL36_ACICA|nr:hypothetical protein [Acinetobacter sp. WU_MDCI_Abxb74]MCU4422723.1 hypothetical protein [Acinetobacter sp. WU_MDCI_Abxb74]VAX45180.1 Uncharacterised protein [Acinetobacter calcoaceticus]